MDIDVVGKGQQVCRNVPNAVKARESIDGITYGKSAAYITQIQKVMGEEGF